MLNYQEPHTFSSSPLNVYSSTQRISTASGFVKYSVSFSGSYLCLCACITAVPGILMFRLKNTNKYISMLLWGNRSYRSYYVSKNYPLKWQKLKGSLHTALGKNKLWDGDSISACVHTRTHTHNSWFNIITLMLIISRVVMTFYL